MKISIIGAGAIGGLVGKLWAEAGHEVFFSSRNPDKLSSLPSKIAGTVHIGTVKAATAFADIILLAINYWTLEEALTEIGSTSGKTIMDATNPYAWAKEGGLYRVIPDDVSGGEALAGQLPEAKVVKVFSSMQARIMNQRHHKTPPLTLFYTTDHEDTKPTVEALISDAGFAPQYYGPITDSIPIELFGKYSDKVLSPEEAKAMLQADGK